MEYSKKRKMLIAYAIFKNRRRRHRTMYIRNIFGNRIRFGETNLVAELRSDDPLYHHRYFRMDKQNFDVIYDKISASLKHKNTHLAPITPLQRLSITIRYLASGDSQRSLAMSYRVSESSVSQILREVMTSICEQFEDCCTYPNENTWLKIAEDYGSLWNFPNCCGAVDGKHIRLKQPPHTGSKYYNYKNYFSIVLLGVVDARYRFIAVDIGKPGSASDGGILQDSDFGKKLESGNLNLPPPKAIVEGLPPFPFVFIGDDGFPLKKNLMRPYPGKYLEKEKRIFNYRLSRARRISENAFGILATRWRILFTSIDCDIDLAILIVKTCVLLHNYLISRNDTNGITVDQENGTEIIPGNWRAIEINGSPVQPLSRVGSNNYSLDAWQIRENFLSYFNSVDGSVSWQNEHVDKV